MLLSRTFCRALLVVLCVVGQPGVQNLLEAVTVKTTSKTKVIYSINMTEHVLPALAVHFQWLLEIALAENALDL